MRLTCPNCGAQYEVPDEVIPTEGRDVQCSACGDTWFQAHPDHPVDAPEAEPEVQEMTDRPPEPEPEPEPEIAAETEASDHPEPGLEAAPAEDEAGAPARSPRSLDPEIADILKEEARREAELRAAESASGLESQPDLGLDDMQDEASRRAQQARERMARLRGAEAEATATPNAPELEPTAGSRRDLLPDIEEINSTLRTTNGKVSGRGEVGPVAEAAPRKKSGFARGFMIAVILGMVLWLAYANAPKIAQSVPQAEPALTAYVGAVDKARLWLDTKLGQYVPR